MPNNSEALQKTYIDEQADSKSREIAWIPIFLFAILKCPC